MRLVNADAYSAEMKERQEAAWKWRNEAIAKEDEVKLARAEGAFTAFTEAKLTMDKHIINPWRRVEVPPKEERREYLIFTDKGYMCSCRWTNNIYGLGASDRWGWCIVDIPQFQKVAYWMPIEPPQEGL